eukprot:scaffold15834_cov141-Amphora_coffeaeformis.AAC.1
MYHSNRGAQIFGRRFGRSSQFATEVRTSRSLQQRCARLGENIPCAAILLWDEEYKNYLRQKNYEVVCSIS